ncbi:uncharacterized protein LOC132563131 [Ylistrum balloti]|uniref:uncharacterized protein LOC132563131 n=1 Tax=Ylistrum balloti TaxID=509963 RepID=UPI002905DA97|nr:uncharacterized protein LOC132563131 [Ylistrum balloti]
MDYFQIGILLILYINVHVSSGTTTNTAATEESTCPRFQTRTENESLIVLYQPSNEYCEMVVTTETVQLRPSTELKAFKKKHKTIRRPMVNFRNTNTLDGQMPCEPLTHNNVGPFVFVNTVQNQCQMLFRIHKQKNPNHEMKQPNTKGKDSGRGKKKGGKKRSKPKKIPKYQFIPTFEYVDEFLY